MTDEEKKQVQNIISARTKLLTAKINQQEEKISSLTQELEEKQQELEAKKQELDEKSNQLDELQSRFDELLSIQGQINASSSQSQPEPEELESNENAPGETPEAEIVEEEHEEQESYLQSLLRQHFSQKKFKPGQEELIEAILSGRDILAVMPDELDRRLCWQLPAMIMPGLTIMISPSLSLSMTQELTGLPAAYIHSSLSQWQRREIFDRAKKGSYKIIYTTPSQIAKEDFIDLVRHTEISMLAVNSRWSDAFYSEYIKIAKAFTSLLFSKRPVMGIFIDTANPEAQSDIKKLMGLREPLCFSSNFSRANLFLDVIRTESKLHSLCSFIEQRPEQCGVVYCTKREMAEEIHIELEQNGIPNVLYHAGKPETPERKQSLDDFNSGRANIIVMTRASASKINRRDVRFSVHYDMPFSLESFYQELMQAGQDGQKSDCVILVSKSDLDAQNISLSSTDAENGALNTREARFEQMTDFCKTKGCLWAFILRYFGQEAPEECNNCGDCSGSLMPEDTSGFDFGNANDAQRQAISASDGPVLIIAGPGTGKTFTLVQRTVYLIQECGVHPENVLIATFTDRAAKELLSRIAYELSKRNISANINEMHVGTFHSLCQKFLQEYINSTRLRKGFRVINEFEQIYMVFRNFEKFAEITGLESVFRTQGKWKRSQEICEYIKTLSEELVSSEDLISDPDISISAIGQALATYQAILRETNALDFSSMLVETYRLLSDNPEILDDICSRITHIMIDEYQDTNYIQEQLVLLLGGERNNICVVGDDDQSLYRFRGATVRNILEFPQKFAMDNCRIIHLVTNYRSNKNIIDFYSSWMDSLKTWGSFRYDKKIEPRKQSPLIGPSVIKLSGVNNSEDWHKKLLRFINNLLASGKLNNYNQIAFLFRSVKAPQVQSLLKFFEKNNINIYSPRSDMFFKRGEICFALGCLIIIFPGYVKALEAGEFAFGGKEPEHILYLKNCLKMVRNYIDKPSYQNLKKWINQKINAHAQLTDSTDYVYSDLLYQLFAIHPFKTVLDVNMNAGITDLRKARNLARLTEIVQNFEQEYNVNALNAEFINTGAKLFFNVYLRFVAESGVSEEPVEENEQAPSGCISFMTIHQAKGMEFPIVFTDSLWDFPKDDKTQNNMLMLRIEKKYFRRSSFEPRDQIKNFDFWRLYYTAFSRARDLLVLTCCEDTSTPSKFFKRVYNSLPDAESSSFRPEVFNFRPVKRSNLKNIYSFTSHVMLYEACPLQYKFYRELGFMPARKNAMLFGTLVHSTLEDIHRTVLRHDEAMITDGNIAEWLNLNYVTFSKSERIYLTKSQREAALQQVLRYVWQQQGDWSAIKNAEVDVTLVRPDYILEGRIDLICSRDDGIEIVDFKSEPKPNINLNQDRAKLENYRRQLHVYAYLLEQSRGLEVRDMCIYYTGEEKGAPVIKFPYNKTDVEKVIASFDETVHKIMHRDFIAGTNNTGVCNGCDFKYYCAHKKL